MLPKQISTGFRYTSASALRNKITLMTPAGTAASGSREEPSVFKADIPASITVWRGREMEQTQHRNANVSHKIIIRYRAGVTSAMLVVSRDQTFQIEYAADPDGQRVELHLMCSLVDDGRN